VRLIRLSPEEVRTAQLEASLAEYGISQKAAKPSRELVFDVIERIARTERRLVRLGEIASELGLRLQATANCTADLVREGRILLVKRGHYLPVVGPK